MSATAIALIRLYRAAAAVLVNTGENFVNNLLNTWIGRIGAPQRSRGCSATSVRDKC